MPSSHLLLHRTLLATALSLSICHAAHAASSSAPTDLDAVVVTAAGFEQVVREAPASITVITR